MTSAIPLIWLWDLHDISHTTDMVMGSAVPIVKLPDVQQPSLMLCHYLEAATSGSTSGLSSNEASFGISAVCTGALQ